MAVYMQYTFAPVVGYSICVCVCNAFHFFFFPQNFSFFLESGTLGTRQYTLNGCFMCICWYEFYMLFGGEKGRSWRR